MAAKPFLFTPGGNAIRRTEIVSLPASEMRFFQDFHTIAQKYNLGLHCSECGEDLHGNNSGHEQTLSVQCGCREFKGERGR